MFLEFYFMRFKKFRADRLFDGYRIHGNDKVLITDNDGKIMDLAAWDDAGEDVQTFHGILTPGLINCHCHLELSHLKNLIPPHTGLIEFLCSVVTKRGFPGELIEEEIKKAENEMYENGIVAVGDIGNTADTANVKSKSRIRWQNFVEVLSFTDEQAEVNLAQYKKIAEELEKRPWSMEHRTSLVPHAPYSISPKTFQRINQLTQNQIISIHNQEHPAEDVLYKTGGGEYLRLFKIFGLHQSPFPVTGLSSIRSVLPYFNKGQTLLLVHNTFMPEEDVVFAKEYAAVFGIKLVWCLCINANLYIENKVPDVEMFLNQNCPLVLGTDSYSSNWQLSIAKEMQSVKNKFPSLPLETILQWVTRNGARALGWEDKLGTFDKGKQPGVVLLQHDLSASQRLA